MKWKQMLRGSSSGRKALEYIAELEQQLGETNEALAACQSEAGGLLAEYERLKERNKQLEHWFHGYRTPEESMAALVEENERLHEIVQAIRKTIWLERAADMIDDGRPYGEEIREDNK
jgi:chromosome segregation ATPase